MRKHTNTLSPSPKGFQSASPRKSAEDSDVRKADDVTHHAEGLVNPKVRANKKVTDFGYPRACRFRKHQIENRSPDLHLPTFFKT
jgi:hypothetical protein